MCISARTCWPEDQRVCALNWLALLAEHTSTSSNSSSMVMKYSRSPPSSTTTSPNEICGHASTVQHFACATAAGAVALTCSLFM